MSEGQPKPKPLDVVLVHGRTPDGQGLRALRARPESVALAELRPLTDGQPLAACEIVRLSPREGHPLLFDVEVQHAVPAPAADHHEGPARVATAAYRRNWEAVFGGEPDDGAEGGGLLN
jgi:hypothetical protein